MQTSSSTNTAFNNINNNNSNIYDETKPVVLVTESYLRKYLYNIYGPSRGNRRSNNNNNNINNINSKLSPANNDVYSGVRVKEVKWAATIALALLHLQDNDI
eukprot:Tbor_TRINITY_DN5886_c4_g12::TRINITY_DN5886_c4_g12_i1::g.6923::m.6923